MCFDQDTAQYCMIHLSNKYNWTVLNLDLFVLNYTLLVLKRRVEWRVAYWADTQIKKTLPLCSSSCSSHQCLILCFSYSTASRLPSSHPHCLFPHLLLLSCLFSLYRLFFSICYLFPYIPLSYLFSLSFVLLLCFSQACICFFPLYCHLCCLRYFENRTPYDEEVDNRCSLHCLRHYHTGVARGRKEIIK